MKRKIKIITFNPRDWEFGGYAEKYGCEVKHVSIGGSVPKRLTGEVTFDGIGEVATREGIKQFFSLLKSFKPDAILFGIHFNLDSHIFERVKEENSGVKIFFHYTDQRTSVAKLVRKYISLIDCMLVTNDDSDDWLKFYNSGVKNIRILYDGVSSYEYWPKPKIPFFDCMFGGNNYYRLAEKMRGDENASVFEKFTGAIFRDRFIELVNIHFNLVIRGNWGWDEGKYFIKPMMYHPKYLDVLREAKIVLSTVNAPRNKLLMRRMIRGIAAQRLYLTQYCPGLESFFVNHKHLVWFKSIEEGIDLIRFYLEHDDLRERIAYFGRKQILKEHSNEKRLQDFIKIYEEIY
jgi:hypothetical protein